jgi:hypothetical protein
MSKRDGVGYLLSCHRCGNQWAVSMKDYTSNMYCPECDRNHVFKGFVENVCSVNERELCTYELMSLGLAKQIFF